MSAMVIACAECGCRVQAGVRVEVCTDPACCCADLRVLSEQPQRPEPPNG